jgi:predicted transcriptional regulator
VRKSLVDLIFRSENRRDLLLFIKEEPRTMEEIKEFLSLPAISILPQIKKLKEGKLVVRRIWPNDKVFKYELTPVGQTIVENMEALLDTLDTLENNSDYWTLRNLEGIPPVLRGRIGELKYSKLIKPDLNHMFELNPEFVESLLQSERVLGCASYFHPSFTGLYLDLAKKGADVCFMLTDPVFERFKADFREEMCSLLGFENVSIFVFPEDSKVAGLTVTDRFFLLALFPEGEFFDNECLICSEPAAMEWGKELFFHLQKQATEVLEI